MTREELEKYAPRLSLVRHTGVIIFWQQYSLSFRGKPEELISKVNAVTLKNMIFGWWSPMSLVLNPIVTLANYFNYYQYKKQFGLFMSNPKHYIDNAKEKEKLDKLKEKRSQKRSLFFFIAIVASFLLVLVYALATNAFEM